MAEIVDYMSWNIEKLSSNKTVKEVFRDVTVPYWIAALVEDMGATAIGVMEVTLGTGDEAVKLLTNAINARQKQKTGNQNWTFKVTDRNVDVYKSTARRADKYALIWDKTNAAVDEASVDVATSSTIDFPDRWPMKWQIKTGKSVLNCLLWHAPQPKYHLKDKTTKLIADLSQEIVKSTGSNQFIVSGDFNYDTSSSVCYKPLTSLGFVGAFDGEKTTLKALKTFMKDIANREKMVAQGDYDGAFLSSAYDNIFLHTVTSNWEFKVCVPYVILNEIQNSVNFQIVTRLQLQLAMKNAKIISDHMPIVLTVEG